MNYIKKRKCFEFEYTTLDEEYIDELVSFIEEKYTDMMLFFDLDIIEKIVHIKLFDDLELFRNTCGALWRGKEVPSWLCGLSFRNQKEDYIFTLCLEEYKKTKGHHHCTLDNLKTLILHEFIHICHKRYTNIKIPIWLGEGLATYLSHQYDGEDLFFDATIEELLEGGTSYMNYYVMVSYALNKYGRNYILRLLKDEEYVKNETYKLYEEVKLIYKTRNI